MRLLSACVSVMGELGYADTTVAHITARARISRRTFYELFDDREDCLSAVFDDTLDRVRQEIAAVALRGLGWRERVRGGLWAILTLFDREPALARMCIVQSARGGQRVLERRTEVFAELAGAIDEAREESTRGMQAPELTAEGLVGAAHAILYARVLKRAPEPLTDLFAGLMSMIVLPYLGSAVARREQERAVPDLPFRAASVTLESDLAESDPLRGLPMRVTYRTIRVLRAIAESPGISNRMVGERAEVTDQGQISKLLSRLEGLGLLANRGEGHTKGEPNAWTLTELGEQLTQRIYVPGQEQAA